MKHSVTLLAVFLLLSCSCRQSISTSDTSSPFAKVLLHNVDAKEPELYLVVDRMDGGAKALDGFVAKHAEAALLEAERHGAVDLTVIFFFRDNPTSDFGSWGGFSIAKLKEIAVEKKAGKVFRSVHAWPGVRFPKTGDAEQD